MTQQAATPINSVETESIINPATGQVERTFVKHTKAQANDIVEKADQAFQSWKKTTMQQRADIMLKIAAEIGNRKPELAALMAQEMGKPVTQAMMEIERCISITEYTAKEDYKALADEERPLENGKKAFIAYEPSGVILGIQPWNFPLYQVVRYSVPNLMAGNAVLLKHASNVWGMAEKVKEIYEAAGLPKGLFGVLLTDNDMTGEIIAHEKVRGVAFTGSARGGKAVAEIAGRHIKKSVLELGGSDPYIVLDDADMDLVIPTCVKARVGNAGQTCVAAKRFIVVESRYEEFKEKFTAAMAAVEYGDPTDENTQMGPIARADLRDGLHKQVEKSIKMGATALLGCKFPEGAGYFYPASILADLTPEMPAYKEELFGPVASLFCVKDEAAAITLANDHEYGLGAGVFSADEARAVNVARQIESGMVSINGFYGSQPNLPFGGVKNSGYGREHGGFGITEFVNIKSIMIGK